MAQQTPVKTPPQRPKIVRTPYGWDCKMEEEASVIPAWSEPHEGGAKRSLMTWAMVPLAIAVVAVLGYKTTVLGGSQAPAATATAHATASAAPATAEPSASATPDTTPEATATPAATPSPAPIATPVPAPVATPVPPVPAATTVHVTGHFAAAAATPTCDNGGKPSDAASASFQCQWGVTAVAGSTVQFNVTWPEAATLYFYVYGPPDHPGAAPPLLFQGSGTGSIHASLPNMPAKSVVIVSAPTKTTTANFDVAITLNQ